jgi:sugar lactone lactonase YvrE
MANVRFDVFLDDLSHPCALGESPVWDHRISKLYWVDIEGKKLFRADTSNGPLEEVGLSGRPGCIALTDDTDLLLVGLEQSVYKYQWSNRELNGLVDLGGKTGHVRLNDGKCDRSGRFWVGSMHSPSSQGLFHGELFMIDYRGAAIRLKEKVGVANGLAFSFDGRYGFFADSPRRKVVRFEFYDGELVKESETVFFDFAEAGLAGKPDGACVDEYGCYWVACGEGATIARITPEGRLDRVVPVPVQKPTSCAFGGNKLNLLFVTSIGGSKAKANSARNGKTLDGHLVVADLGVKGVTEGVFAC